MDFLSRVFNLENEMMMYRFWFSRTKVMCEAIVTMKDKVDESYHEQIGKSCWSYKDRGDGQWAAIWLHAKKQHQQCNVFFESVDEEV